VIDCSNSNDDDEVIQVVMPTKNKISRFSRAKFNGSKHARRLCFGAVGGNSCRRKTPSELERSSAPHAKQSSR